MKRLTATLASLTIALAVGAPIASAKKAPGSHGVSHAAYRQNVRQIGSHAAKQPLKKAAVRFAKYMRAF